MINPSKSNSDSQKIRHDWTRQRSRCLFGIQCRVPRVTDHHAADSLGELLKDRKLCPVQFVAAPIDARQLMMRVQRRRGVTGKMLSAG